MRPRITTRLIAQTLQCDHVVGFDTSESFLKLARAAAPDRVSFKIHDITAVPFPCRAAEVIFCRFLLTHLEDPDAIVARWATQLNPGGLLLIEEVETIRTTHPVFARYLQIVEAMLASQSNRLYAGAAGGSAGPSGRAQAAAKRDTDSSRQELRCGWYVRAEHGGVERKSFVRANYPRESILEFETACRTAQEESPARDIIWRLHQGSFRRESG